MKERDWTRGNEKAWKNKRIDCRQAGAIHTHTRWRLGSVGPCVGRGEHLCLYQPTQKRRRASPLSHSQRPARPSPNRPVSITQTNLEHSAPQLISIWKTARQNASWVAQQYATFDYICCVKSSFSQSVVYFIMNKELLCRIWSLCTLRHISTVINIVNI